MTTATQKRCTKCAVEKPLPQFNRHKLGPWGRSSWCKACTSEYGRAWKKKRWANDLEFREKSRAQYTQWVKDNPKRRAATTKQWEMENRERRKASNKRWRKANPQKVSVIAKRKYQKKKQEHPEKFLCWQAVGSHVRRGKIPRPDTLPCAFCGERAEHYHHWNGYAFENRLKVIPLCRPCHIEADR